MTLLHVSLKPRMSEAGDREEIDEAILECERLVTKILPNFNGREFDLPGRGQLVDFGDLSKALNCALQIERLIREYNDKQIPMNRVVLGIGIHHAEGGADRGWIMGTGLQVVSALCACAARTGGVIISEDAREAVTSQSGFRFEPIGSWPIDEEKRQRIKVYHLYAGGFVGLALGSLGHGFVPILRFAPWVIAAAIVAMLAGLEITKVDLGGGLGGIKGWPMFQSRPPQSIAVLPFEEGGFRPSAGSYGETIPAHVIDDLMLLKGIKVSSRTASFSLRDKAGDLEYLGESLGVEAVVRGYAAVSGDWILVRAAAVRTSDGSPVWSGSYYKRLEEVDQIQQLMVHGITGALGLRKTRKDGTLAKIVRKKTRDYEELKSDLEDALKQAQQLELDDATRIASLSNLAALYYDSGRDAEAIPAYREVIKLRERTLGSNHPEVAVNLNNLASAYVAVGRYDAAEPLFLKSLEIRERTLGPSHPRVGNALNNLASLYHRQGRLAKAERFYTRSLEIRRLELELELGPEASRFTDQGVEYELSGELQQAQKYYEQALDSERKASGEDHVRTAVATRRVGKVHAMRGNYRKSESLLSRALAIFKDKMGRNHREVGRTQGDLGELHRRSGHLVEAERYHERSVKTLEHALGVDHPEVAGALGYLVSIFEVQGRKEEAESARARQKRIESIHLAPVFSYVAARSKGPMVTRDRVKDELSVPQPMHEYMVTVEDARLTNVKRRFAESLHGLGLLYVEQGKYARAVVQNLQALEIREAISGRFHPEVAMSLHSLAEIYTLQGRYADASQSYVEARQIFQTTLGRVHPHVARCWEGYAEVLRLTDRANEAESAARHAREIRNAIGTELAPPTDLTNNVRFQG